MAGYWVDADVTRKLFLTEFLLVDPRDLWITDAAMLVEDGRVMDYGRREEMDPQGAEVVDLGKTAVIPGFVNAHAHTAMAMLRGVGDGLTLQEWLTKKVWPIEARMSRDHIIYGNLLGIAEQLQSGITAFVDFYNVEPMAEVLKEMPMRAVLTLAFMDRVEYMEEESWRRIDRVEDYLELVHRVGGGRIKLALGPHAPYSCSEELLSRIAMKANEVGLKVHTHLSETTTEVEEIRRMTGLTPVFYLDTLGLVDDKLIAAHGVHLTEEEAALLGRKGASVVHCPRSNSRLGVGIADIALLRTQGVNIALGTDGPASSDSMNMLEEAKFMIYLQRAMKGGPAVAKAREALIAATVGSARAAGLEDVGTLRKGFRADFIVFDLESPRLNPIWDLTTNIMMGATTADIKGVYVGGEQLVEGGNVHMKGLSKALEKAREFTDIVNARS